MLFTCITSYVLHFKHVCSSILSVLFHHIIMRDVSYKLKNYECVKHLAIEHNIGIRINFLIL